MSGAYFVQKQDQSIPVSAASRFPVRLYSMRLPPGAYVIIAKFNVAAAWDELEGERVSLFGLSFRDAVDHTYCEMRHPGELRTVVLTVAATLTAQVVANGQARTARANLTCEQTSHDMEVKRLAMTAIAVDSVDPPLP